MLDSRPRTASPGSSARPLVADAAAVVGVLLLLSVVVGLLWPQLVDPVLYVRTPDGVVTDEAQLAEQFDDDGWYAVLAAAAGAVAGGALTLWRDRDPVATVVLLLLGACLAAGVMDLVGQLAGPPPADVALADAPEGTTAPDAVRVRAVAAYCVWPIATLFGAVVVLWTRGGPYVEVR